MVFLKYKLDLKKCFYSERVKLEVSQVEQSYNSRSGQFSTDEPTHKTNKYATNPLYFNWKEMKTQAVTVILVVSVSFYNFFFYLKVYNLWL